MGFLIGHIHEIAGMKPFSHQPALHIHKTDQNGIDRSVGYPLFKLFKCQIRNHGAPFVSLI